MAFLTVVSVTLTVVAGCPEPDKKLEEFVMRRADAAGLDSAVMLPPDAAMVDARPPGEGGQPGMDAGVDAGIATKVPDISGTFYVALAASINPDLPLLFLSDVKFRPNPDGVTAVIDWTVRPLRVADKKPLGPSFTAKDVQVDADLKLSADFGTIGFSGDANPVSGMDIEVSVLAKMQIKSKDFFCGDALGMIHKPTPIPLDGSTLAAIRVAPGTEGDALPPYRSTCQ